MKLYSTSASAADGEITILAIIETVIAVALSLLLVKLLATVTHIVLGALIAPFLFLRTETYTAAVYHFFDAAFLKFTRPISFLARGYDRLPPVVRGWLFFVLVLPLCSLFLIIVKLIATILALASAPREALLAIPGNWLRITLATDSARSPELLPGADLADDAPATVQMLRYDDLCRRIASANARPVLKKLTLLAILVPTLIYRLFLKSTSLVYFPLIWVSGVPLTTSGVLNLPLERVRRWYAFAILLIMFSPLLISFHFHETLVSPHHGVVITYALPISKVDLWHISRVLAVAVTFSLYLYARKLKPETVQDPAKERSLIVGANRLRAACALFTMGCFLAIVIAL